MQPLWAVTCEEEGGPKEELLPARNNEIEASRHVILSSSRGVITELEKLESDKYVIRCHKAANADIMLQAGAWIGFRYSDAHWSFLEQQITD